MNVKYEIDPTLAADEIIIRCKEINQQIMEIQRILRTNTVEAVFGIRENKIYPIKPNTIERIFIENRKSIICSKGETYESKTTLAEFEAMLGTTFVRISKSVIANIKQIRSIESEFSGNFTLIFISGNKEILSRSYVKTLKKAIGLEG